MDVAQLSVDGALPGAGMVFLLIFLAEFGDKSQLVCMTLAARHRPWPVLAGAVLAFALLNLLAVLFGAAVARWIPPLWIALAVAVLFSVFGLQALMAGAEEEGESIPMASRGVLLTALLMIFVAEFGDKTQLAVAGMGATLAPLAVWSSATLALTATSVLGVLLGRTLLQRLPVGWLHRGSGVLFLLMAVGAFYQVSVEWGLYPNS